MIIFDNNDKSIIFAGKLQREMIDNPFVTNGYAGPDYFCDRIDETAILTKLLSNGNNVALMSPRRVGKTDLIRHSFQQESIKVF